jgi:uncharacterized protein
VRAATIVMVKAPLPGFAKTRLCPPLSQSDAASLSLCFLQDVINSAVRVIPDVIVAFTPDGGRMMLEGSLPNQMVWIKQEGDNLGERLNSAIAYVANLGFSPLIVLGADSPTLPPLFIETARAALASNDADVVLGPTTDGGYYLLGVRKPVPNLFNYVAWSTDRTFTQTAHNIKQLGLRLLELPRWYDVDTFADLDRLCSELSSNPKPRPLAEATHRWLLNHGLLRLPAS